MLKSKFIKDTLDNLFKNNDTVFIVPHNRPDMDAIGSCIAMNLICNHEHKKSYIIIDDDEEKIEKVARGIIKDNYHAFKIINLESARKLMTPNSLLIVLDTNKDYLISVAEDLDKFKDIIVIDHHKTDEKTIKTRHLFVDESLSSTCEEMGMLLNLYNIKPEAKYANYLLAGIILDTNKFSNHVSSQTYAIASTLLNNGADVTEANNLFLEDFEHDRAVQRLVENTEFSSYTYAIATDKDDSNKIYDIEDIAKAADYLLKYQVTASFTIAKVSEDTISISARSKGVVDVAKIMRMFGGGGNEKSAAARIKGMSVEDAKHALKTILVPTVFLVYNDLEPLNEMSLKLENN